jgi:hypothetical protein
VQLNHRTLAAGILALLLTLSVVSASEQESVKSVTGTIRGTEVELIHAEYDGTLSIYQGEGWGHNPSLLLFMFFGDDEIPSGRTIEIAVDDKAEDDRPHVHYRWVDDNGAIQAEAVVHHYRMRLTFGDVEGDVLPGTIEFSVPGEETRVRGRFRAALMLEEAAKTAPPHSNRSHSALRSSSTQRP